MVTPQDISDTETDLKWWLDFGVYFSGANPVCVCSPFSVTRVRLVTYDCHRWPFLHLPLPMESISGFFFLLEIITLLVKEQNADIPGPAWRLHVV